jgi:hypothetical protein
LANGVKDTDRFSRRGAEGAENNYRYKGRVTRDKVNKDDIRPFSFWERAEVRED